MEKIPGRVELTPSQLTQVLSDIERSNLPARTKAILTDALKAIVWIQESLERKSVTVKKLLRIFFGKKTEKASDIQPGDPGKESDSKDHGDDDKNGGGAGASASGSKAGESGAQASPDTQKKGHGKHGARAYSGAEHIHCPHGTLKAGDLCPECKLSKLCECESGSVLHITGQAPFHAQVFHPEKLRCPLCGAYFVASLPDGVTAEKRFDPTANSLVSVLKYGSGLPFYRNEKLTVSLGLPLPASTQWNMAETAAGAGLPVYRYLITYGAQGGIHYHDDTKVKILSLVQENKTLEEGERCGMQTTGILAENAGHEIALFMSGRKHAGENLGTLLEKRAKNLPTPIQVADALAANTSHDYKTILVNCLDHARREFLDVEGYYAAETAHVIRELGRAYHFDQVAKEQKLSSEERLQFHQQNSGPVMGCLKTWAEQSLALKRVEPNSAMGEALRYLLKHWDALSRFLTVAGAPLSNAKVERLLKTAILHRKNSLFYKTMAGAWVGDVLMSLIQTAIRAGANPFLYLTELQKFKRAVLQAPELWLPWNYLQTIAALPASASTAA